MRTKLEKLRDKLRHDANNSIAASPEYLYQLSDKIDAIVSYYKNRQGPSHTYNEIERTAIRSAMSSLAAAISLLERGGRKAAPSDKMFNHMLKDYKIALHNARLVLNKENAPSAEEPHKLPCVLRVGGARFNPGVEIATAQKSIDRLWHEYLRLKEKYEPTPTELKEMLDKPPHLWPSPITEACPSGKEGIHCQCWYDDTAPCCFCGDDTRDPTADPTERTKKE